MKQTSIMVIVILVVLCLVALIIDSTLPKDPPVGSVWAIYDDNPFHTMVGTDSVLETRHTDWMRQDQCVKYVDLRTGETKIEWYFTDGRKQIR
jgi:hypothetical protein